MRTNMLYFQRFSVDDEEAPEDNELEKKTSQSLYQTPNNKNKTTLYSSALYISVTFDTKLCWK